MSTTTIAQPYLADTATLVTLGIIVVLTVGSLAVFLGVPVMELRAHHRMVMYREAREARAYLALVRLRARGHLLLAGRLERHLDGNPQARSERLRELVDSGAGGQPDLAQRLREAYGLT